MKQFIAGYNYAFLFPSPKKPKTKEVFPDWSMEETAEDIYHLDDSGFESFAEDQEDMLVFFYSPSRPLFSEKFLSNLFLSVAIAAGLINQTASKITKKCLCFATSYRSLINFFHLPKVTVAAAFRC